MHLIIGFITNLALYSKGFFCTFTVTLKKEKLYLCLQKKEDSSNDVFYLKVENLSHGVLIYPYLFFRYFLFKTHYHCHFSNGAYQVFSFRFCTKY